MAGKFIVIIDRLMLPSFNLMAVGVVLAFGFAGLS